MMRSKRNSRTRARFRRWLRFDTEIAKALANFPMIPLALAENGYGDFCRSTRDDIQAVGLIRIRSELEEKYGPVSVRKLEQFLGITEYRRKRLEDVAFTLSRRLRQLEPLTGQWIGM